MRAEGSQKKHWRGRIVAPSCCLWLVTGCVQGPDYVKPTVAVPPAYRFGEQFPGSAQAPAGLDAYRDAYLDGLVREALANNLDLRIATARVDEFAAILAGRKSQSSPQIVDALSINQPRASEDKIPNIVDPLSTTFSTVLSASWEIDL